MAEENQKPEMEFVGYKGHVKDSGKGKIDYLYNDKYSNYLEYWNEIICGKGSMDYLYNDTLTIRGTDNDKVVLEVSQTMPSGMKDVVGVIIPLAKIEKLIEGIKAKKSITIRSEKNEKVVP